MARLERIRLRLENWALWKSRQNDAGLGFHSRNILAVDVWSRGTYNGAVIPVAEQEAEETDKAVESLRPRAHLYDTVLAFYVSEIGVNEAARIAGVKRATIYARLGEADIAIDTWLADQAAERERQAAVVKGAAYMAKGSFTT